MSRPRTISDEEILDAARDLFLERGVSVTTAEIARRAGISEGTIFRRFATKDELFMAAMQHHVDAHRWLALEQMIGQGEVRQNLVRIVRELVDVFQVLVPSVLVISGDRSRLSRAPQCMHGPRSNHRKFHLALTRYLAEEMRRGRIRDTDAEMVARTLSAATWNYVFHETIGSQVYNPVDADTFAGSLVTMVWNGLSNEPASGGN